MRSPNSVASFRVGLCSPTIEFAAGEFASITYIDVLSKSRTTMTLEQDYSDFQWTTGDQPGVSHRRTIASGGAGDVHEAFVIHGKSANLKIDV